MKKYRSLITFLVGCFLSALIFYLSGAPLERGTGLAFWAFETFVLAGGAAFVAKDGV